MTAPTKRLEREPTPEMIEAAEQALADFSLARIWRRMWDAAPDADAGRVAELGRELAASVGREKGKQIVIGQLERRIERALKTLTTPTMNLPGTTGGGFIERTLAILRGKDFDA